jgi:hypothetical protein
MKRKRNDINNNNNNKRIKINKTIKKENKIIEICFNSGNIFKYIINSLSELFLTININISNEGIKCSSLNDSKAILCEIFIKNDIGDEKIFSSYNCSFNSDITINVNSIKKILNIIKDENNLILKIVKVSPDILTFISLKKNGEKDVLDIKLINFEGEKEPLNIPIEIYKNSNCDVKLRSREFKDIFKNISLLDSEYVNMILNSKEIKFICNNNIIDYKKIIPDKSNIKENITMNYKIRLDNLIQSKNKITDKDKEKLKKELINEFKYNSMVEINIDDKNSVNMKYKASFITKISKYSNKLSRTVQFYFIKDNPLLIELLLLNNKESFIRYYIAPIIED